MIYSSSPLPASSCSYCGRSCNCGSNVVTFFPSNSPRHPTFWDLELEQLEEDVERALRRKWEIHLRFLDSIRPANQPRDLRPTAPRQSPLELRHQAIRASRFRSVARSRPGHRGSTDGKRRLLLSS